MHLSVSLAILLAAGVSASIASPVGYYQTDLASNIPGLANFTDPNLKNPWGISFGPTTPFWVADNSTGRSTLYAGNGQPQALVVTVPAALGSAPGTSGTPTGTVFNANSATGAFMADRFLFATEDGGIMGWQPALGTTAAHRVDLLGASYKGLAIAGNRIYATNFATGNVDVFDNNYAPVNLPGGFTDPTLPSGFAPFGIETINGAIYVTYAKKETGGDDDVPGPGFGFVDKFDTNGVMLQRVITGGALNSPWGLALAPATFGDLANLLLVGNFGDGRINAYDATGAFVSTLNDASGNPIAVDGLWAMKFGNGGPGFSSSSLYFTAGLNDEADGLFGRLQAVPEPGTALLMSAGFLMVVANRRTRKRMN